MPRNTDSLHLSELSRLLSEAALGLLLDIRVPSSPPTVFRLTTFDARIPYGEDEDGLPIYYYPWPIEMSAIEVASQGDLPRMTITVSNTRDLKVARIVDQYGGLEGENVNIRIVSENALSDTDSFALEEFMQITTVSMTSQAITINLSAGPLYDEPMPRLRYSRVRCRETFGSAGCGYAIGVGGATLTQCPGYTLEACEQVGAEEAARGIVGLHPRYFGGQRGIPSRRR